MIASLAALIGAFFTIALVDTCLPRRQQPLERQNIEIYCQFSSVKRYCSFCQTSNELTWVSELNCKHQYCPTCYNAHVNNKRECPICNFHIHSIKMINYRAHPPDL